MSNFEGFLMNLKIRNTLTLCGALKIRPNLKISAKVIQDIQKKLVGFLFVCVCVVRVRQKCQSSLSETRRLYLATCLFFINYVHVNFEFLHM